MRQPSGPDTVLFSILLLGVLTLVGCGEDSPTEPVPTTARLSVDVDPDSLDATWRLIRPDQSQVHGHGDQDLGDVEPGEYLFHWGPMDGWVADQPDPTVLLLSAGDVHVARCRYFEIRPSTIQIRAEPEGYLSSEWVLENVDGFRISGTGDTTLDEVNPGIYTITWFEVANWNPPQPAQQTLFAPPDGQVLFTTYYESRRTVVVETEPVCLSTSWRLTTPLGEVLEGNNSEAKRNMVPGTYSVEFDDVHGWINPGSVQMVLAPDQTMISMTGTYETVSSGPEILVPSDQSTIQNAVCAADPGTVIRVACGSYSEAPVHIDRSLTVEGVEADPNCVVLAGRVVIEPDTANGESTVVALKSLTLRGGSSGPGPTPGSDASLAGVSATGVHELQLQNCIVEGFERDGLFIAGSPDVHLENCAIHDNGRYAIFAANSEVSMVKCLVHSNGGACFATASRFLVQETTISHNGAPGGATIEFHTFLSLTLERSIIAFTQGGRAVEDHPSAGSFFFAAQCSDIYANEGGDWIGELEYHADRMGNFTADPLFLDPQLGDFGVAPDSPCRASNNTCMEEIGWR